MALKDWEKRTSSGGDTSYSKADGKFKSTHIKISKVGDMYLLRIEKNGKFVVNKKLKTEAQAETKARNYMRTH